MGGKSGYLAKKQAELDEYMHIAERVTRQYDVDTLQIALSRYSKLNLGFQRIMEITDLWEQVRQEYFTALSRGPESDVARHHLDAELRQITKDKMELIPYERRYPEMRSISYEGRRKK